MTHLMLHNSLAGEKQSFAPIDPKNVRIYACGPTVYSYAHIGNARMSVTFDILARTLRHIYGADHVQYASNITDVDDKIMAAADKEGVPISEITAKYEKIYFEDMAALNIDKPDHVPHATDHIDDMITMIEELMRRGHAYAADGHVLFNVPSDPNYGQLSRRSRDEMIAGARVEVASYKKDPADFILWKPSSDDQPGWDSPWGRGRPGWHIECSAMTRTLFGDHFDIHGGGADLKFPHHENEIAQSACSCDDHTFCNVWVHNGFVTVSGEKMSKSIGNITLAHDLLKAAPGEAIRLALMAAHYRQPLDWSEQGLNDAKKTLDKFYRILEATDGLAADMQADMPAGITDALCDDLNTPKAIAALHSLAAQLKSAEEAGERACLKGQFLKGAHLLGLLYQDPAAWLAANTAQTDIPAEEIEAAIAARNQAKKDKDFALSDKIRDDLAAKGIILKDTRDGTTWSVES